MYRSISKRDDPKRFSIEFPKYASSAIKKGKRCSNDDCSGSCERLGIYRRQLFILKLGKGNDAEKERERHDKAVKQLEVAQAAWNKQRMQRLDFINEDIKKSITQCIL